MFCRICGKQKDCNKGKWEVHTNTKHGYPCNYQEEGCKFAFIRGRDVNKHLMYSCLFIKRSSKMENLKNIQSNNILSYKLINVANFLTILRKNLSCFQHISFDLTLPEVRMKKLLNKIAFKINIAQFLTNLYQISENFLKTLKINELKILFLLCNADPKKSFVPFLFGIKERKYSQIMKKFNVEQKKFLKLETYQYLRKSYKQMKSKIIPEDNNYEVKYNSTNFMVSYAFDSIFEIMSEQNCCNIICRIDIRMLFISIYLFIY